MRPTSLLVHASLVAALVLLLSMSACAPVLSLG
jgi:hypothetical protein